MTPVEKYRIIRPLGNQKRRKFNDVYLAEDKTTGERASLKVLAKTANNHSLQDRLRQEAHFSFTHPGLPKTLDLYETETELLLFRSFHEGIPLDSFAAILKRKEKPAFILALLQQLEPMMDVLAAQHIVHLDLKPSNLIIDGTASAFSVALIDFGLALDLQNVQPRTTLFPLGYAAPELLLNRLELADQRTDQFALGIVLWQLFTGKLPLLHPNPSITTNLQLTHPLPEDAAIPNRFFQVLATMTAKHSFNVPPNQLPKTEQDAFLREAMNRRYASFREIIAAWETAMRQKRWWER